MFVSCAVIAVLLPPFFLLSLVSLVPFRVFCLMPQNARSTFAAFAEPMFQNKPSFRRFMIWFVVFRRRGQNIIPYGGVVAMTDFHRQLFACEHEKMCHLAAI